MTDKARELLERAIEEWDSDRDLYEFHKVMEEIRDFLSTPEPEQDEEPVAWMHLDGDSTCTANTKKYGAVDKLYCIPLYLYPAPRPEFVRLSEKEVNEILFLAHTPYEAICATENMLVRKNTINKSDPDSIDLQSRCRGDKL